MDNGILRIRIEEVFGDIDGQKVKELKATIEMVNKTFNLDLKARSNASKPELKAILEAAKAQLLFKLFAEDESGPSASSTTTQAPNAREQVSSNGVTQELQAMALNAEEVQSKNTAFTVDDVKDVFGNIDLHNGNKLRDICTVANAEFGGNQKLPQALHADEKKNVMKAYKAKLMLQVAERTGSYVVPISWQPASAEDLMHMVWIVCDQVWRRDLRKSYGDELRAQYAVQHRLESMGATTKTEGVLRLIYPHYKYMIEGTTRSHMRFDMLVTMGNFKVLVEFKVGKDRISDNHRFQLWKYLTALREDDLKLPYAWVINFPKNGNPMLSDMTNWLDKQSIYCHANFRDCELGNVFDQEVEDNYRIFKEDLFVAKYKQV